MKTALILGLICCPFLVASQIQLLNDEFDDNRSEVNWQDINVVEQWGIDQWDWVSINDSTAGSLQLAPITASWFGEYRGPLLFKLVSGNFIFSTKVDVFGRDFDFPINDNFNLAGVMVRTPQHYPNGALGSGGWQMGQQNFVFLSAGNASSNHPSCPGCTPPQFEVKSTTNSVSQLEVSEIDTSSVEIRMVRIDSAILALYRLAETANWEVHRRYNRSDFPDTLQVGLVVYTDWAGVSSTTPQIHNMTELNINPDIIGEFEYARFDSVVVPAGLIGLDFSDESAVSDNDILSFLAFDSAPWCPESISLHHPIDSNTFHNLYASQSIDLDTTIMSDAVLLLHADEVNINPVGIVVDGALIEIDQEGCNP